MKRICKHCEWYNSSGDNKDVGTCHYHVLVMKSEDVLGDLHKLIKNPLTMLVVAPLVGPSFRCKQWIPEQEGEDKTNG